MGCALFFVDLDLPAKGRPFLKAATPLTDSRTFSGRVQIVNLPLCRRARPSDGSQPLIPWNCMRAYSLVVVSGLVGAIAAAGCGSSEELGKKMDATTTPDVVVEHQPAADGGSDRGGAGGTTTDARDAPPESGSDAPPDLAQDLAAADAIEDATASVDVATDAADAAGPALVTVQFSGQVVTVAGTPLGLDSTARLAPVSGSFAYDLRVPDSSPTDPLRGRYLHGGTFQSHFTFNVSGHVVTGSGSAIVETENLNPDTFRFRDGQQNDGATRIMKLDGTDRPALTLLIAITDSSGAALTSDAEPNPFPFTDSAVDGGISHIPHTFSISDGTSDAGTNTLLMQLDSMTQQ
jgi:hypothetical protein